MYNSNKKINKKFHLYLSIDRLQSKWIPFGFPNLSEKQRAATADSVFVTLEKIRRFILL